VELHERIVVPTSIQDAWAAFTDVTRVVACMPGTELTEHLDDRSYRGRLTVKLGPITANFEGLATVEFDEAAHRGVISAKGTDHRGGSKASGKITYELVPQGDETVIDIRADILLMGALAQFGRTGLIQELTSQLTAEFAECLKANLAPGSQGATTAAVGEPRPTSGVNVLRLVLVTLWRRIVRLITRLTGRGDRRSVGPGSSRDADGGAPRERM
jgi:carbon monoxide dehydrogenase subunit G